MNKFIQRFKNLPWMALWQSVTLTYLIVAIAEVLMIWGITQSLALRKMIKILYAQPLDLLILFGVGVGVGALAIYLIEIRPPKIFLNTTCLWVLFLCLLVTLLIYKSIFPPVLLLSTSQITIMGILMGLFWKGRTYWR